MQFAGIQKLSLLDYPDKISATLFTRGCNFRCPFCHNRSLLENQQDPADLSAVEVLAFLKKRKNVLEGVCISGGEPLLQPGLERFISEVKALGYPVKLDTNGSFPEKLADLISKNLLDYVAMDIKNAPESYEQTAGSENVSVDAVKESVNLLLLEKVAYEFRTTLVREFHTKAQLLLIAKWIKGARRYYLQNFVASDEVLQDGLSSFTEEELQAFKASVSLLIPEVELRGIN